MTITVSAEFRAICASIIAQQRSLAAWRKNEADDMFQGERFCGGFDATEDAFCFSYYDSDRREFWFQLTLDEVASVADEKLQSISIRAADTFNA